MSSASAPGCSAIRPSAYCARGGCRRSRNERDCHCAHGMGHTVTGSDLKPSAVTERCVVPVLPSRSDTTQPMWGRPMWSPGRLRSMRTIPRSSKPLDEGSRRFLGRKLWLPSHRSSAALQWREPTERPPLRRCWRFSSSREVGDPVPHRRRRQRDRYQRGLGPG